MSKNDDIIAVINNVQSNTLFNPKPTPIPSLAFTPINTLTTTDSYDKDYNITDYKEEIAKDITTNRGKKDKDITTNGGKKDKGATTYRGDKDSPTSGVGPIISTSISSTLPSAAKVLPPKSKYKETSVLYL